MERPHILLVDDQPARLLTYEAILQDLGHVLVKANSGREALERLMDDEFAAILLDVSMPDMDGFETAALIRDHPRFESTPIIFVTAVHMTDMDELRGYRIGAVDYVYVPVIPEILRGKVQVLAELYLHRQALQRMNTELEQANARLTEAHAALREEKSRELLALNRVLESANADLEATNAQLRREVADRESAERELQAAADRKDRFLALLSHELRNPLSAVHNAVQVMRAQAPSGSVQSAMAAVLARHVGHLGRLLDDLLDVSRISTGRLRLRIERVSMADVIDHALEMVAPDIAANGQTVLWHAPAREVNVYGDAVRLKQVVNNLVRNASKYTGQGGRIEIELEGTLHDSGRHDAIQPGATLRVRDSGIGIAASMLPRVFEMFAEVKPGDDSFEAGLGVGLSLVRAIVELHGGQVEAISDGVGRGAEFVVRLPLGDADGALSINAEDRSRRQATPRRVLVIDDNVDSAEALAVWLRLLGHEVALAHTGRSGISAAIEQPPEVILLDIGLPEMDGYEVVRNLRSAPALTSVPIVAVTGYGAQTDRERAIAAGFDRHMTKPIDHDALNQLLSDLAALRPSQSRDPSVPQSATRGARVFQG